MTKGCVGSLLQLPTLSPSPFSLFLFPLRPPRTAFTSLATARTSRAFLTHSISLARSSRHVAAAAWSAWGSVFDTAGWTSTLL